MSIKNIAKWIYILTILAIIWFVIVNTFISSTWHDEFKTIKASINDVEEVFESLEGSIDDCDQLKLELEEPMTLAQRSEIIAKYNNSLSTTLKIIETGKKQLIEISRMRDSIIIFKIKNEVILAEFDEKLEVLIQTLYMTQVQFESMGLDGPQRSDVEIQPIKAEDIHAIDDLFENIISLYFDDILGAMNFFNTVLILTLFLTGVFIHKLISKDLRFFSESLKCIDERNYDIGNLPSYKSMFIEEKEFRILVNQIFNKQKLSADIKNMLMKTYEMDELLEQLFLGITDLLQIDRLGVGFIDYEQEKIIAEYSVANYNEMFLNPGYETNFSNTSLKKIIEGSTGFISKNLVEEFETKPSSKTLKLLLKEGIKSNMVIPIIANKEVLGLIFFSSKKIDHFTEGHARIANDIMHEISGFIVRAFLTKVIFSKMTVAFSRLVDYKDNETGDHLERMTAYSLIIAGGLRERNLLGYEMNKKMELDISRYAGVHDIGKVGVPEHILNKPGKFNPDEWEIMKSHVEIGRDIFRKIREGLHIFDNTFFQVAEDVVACHHEKWDGSGYPRGLKGQEIPLVSRIVALGDVFDALTSKRVYKDAFTLENAIEIIKDSRGKHFDPVIVDIFLEEIEGIREIYVGHFMMENTSL